MTKADVTVRVESAVATETMAERNLMVGRVDTKRTVVWFVLRMHSLLEQVYRRAVLHTSMIQELFFANVT